MRFKNFNASLVNILTPQILDEDNKVFCEKCQQKQVHESRFEVKEFPEILTFNISRFEYDQFTYERKKIDLEFTFPLQFDILDFLGRFEGIQ